jgi:hypothetical protein
MLIALKTLRKDDILRHEKVTKYKKNRRLKGGGKIGDTHASISCSFYERKRKK